MKLATLLCSDQRCVACMIDGKAEGKARIGRSSLDIIGSSTRHEQREPVVEEGEMVRLV